MRRGDRGIGSVTFVAGTYKSSTSFVQRLGDQSMGGLACMTIKAEQDGATVTASGRCDLAPAPGVALPSVRGTYSTLR